MAGIGQVSLIQRLDNKHWLKGLQELFALTLPLILLTLERPLLAVSLAVGREYDHPHCPVEVQLNPVHPGVGKTLRYSVKVKNTALQCNGSGLGTVVGFQFREKMAHVELHGGFSYPKGTTNLFVASAHRDVFQNFDFACGEFGATHAFGQACADGG
jgi:hypothetical protein